MGNKRKTVVRRPLTERREPYISVFLLGFGILLVMILPVMLFTGGYFIYYGDFNSQQLPFYYLAHESVRSGAFGWNWKTDLGSNFLGSYSFYLMGSPFFWLTVPFPQEWTLYLIPYLLALKHGFAALTAYAYIRRFVRSREAALIGGLLYAFSGFQLYNIFFNHFQDVTAFFPLLLIAMEQRVNENRRGIFAVTVAFMAILNYYFFTGQAVFVILYFIIRCTAKDFHADLRKFFSIALEAVIGVMLACFMLLPSAFAIMDNYRIRTRLYGNDMIAYSDRVRIWHIIQSFFMLPDAPARPNLFRTDYGKWASIGGYLPMFSMAGVIAFMTQKRKHWATRLTALCTVCAMIPILNSMFYTFNGSYYARWFYMPILIMAMMTAYALDNPKIKWRGGLITCGAFLIGFGVISLFPRKTDEGEIVWFDFARYAWYFWLMLILCAIMLYFAVTAIIMRKRGRGFYRTVIVMTVFSCLCAGFGMLYFGIGLGANPSLYVNTAIKGKDEIRLDDPADQFYRVDISEDYDNYPMIWGYSNMRCFHSIVPTSVMDFYDALGITRDVASRPERKHYPLRNLFSVRYYFDRDKAPQEGEESSEKTGWLQDMPGFRFKEKANGFNIYENEAFIPMGLAYDYFIDEDALAETVPLTREKLMLKALAMSSEQMEQYSDILTTMPGNERYGMDDAQFLEYCKARAAQTCDSFSYDSYGFRAHIALEQPKMVFFSVPYEDGWSAEVNGKAVPVEKVNVGFMAVRGEAGDNHIVFRYETPGLRSGAVTSLCGLAALVLYLIWMAVREKDVLPKTAARKYCYDYASVGMMSEHLAYLNYAACKNLGSRQLPPAEKNHKIQTDQKAEESSDET